MYVDEQKVLHNKINGFQHLTVEEQVKIHDTIDGLISGKNGWDRIDKIFKEDERLKKYFIEARDEAWRDNCQSLVSMMVMTIENLLDIAENYERLMEDDSDEIKEDNTKEDVTEDKFEQMLTITQQMEDFDSEEEINKGRDEIIKIINIAAELAKANKKNGISIKDL